MYDSWLTIRSMEPNDFVDILLVAAVFYGLFAILRGSRSWVVLQGMVTILIGSFLIYFLANTFKLTALMAVFRSFWVIAILLFIVVFQHDFRRSLTQLGQLRIFRNLFTQRGLFLDDLLLAVRQMAQRRVGALIAFERRNTLRVYADTGTPLDSVISEKLIQTIFASHTPLHDGAIIIRDDRLLAAGCIFPLGQESIYAKDLGTRHMAAVGLSEETDAVVLVVSEETGIISLAVGGELRRGLNQEALKEMLIQELDIEEGAA